MPKRLLAHSTGYIVKKFQYVWRGHSWVPPSEGVGREMGPEWCGYPAAYEQTEKKTKKRYLRRSAGGRKYLQKAKIVLQLNGIKYSNQLPTDGSGSTGPIIIINGPTLFQETRFTVQYFSTF